MTMTSIETMGLKAGANTLFLKKRLMAFGLPVLVLAYLTYIFFSFDIPGLAERANLDNGKTLIRDSYSYKTHVTRDNRSGQMSYAIEGERKGTYPDGEHPAWVQPGADRILVDLGGGDTVVLSDAGVEVTLASGYAFTAQPGRSGVNAVLPEGAPDTISGTKNRLVVTNPGNRITITRNRTELYRYAFGWELFFFTLDSDYHGMGLGELANRAMSGEAGKIVSDFWNNKMWRHGDVVWALFETILMAFLGTMGAAIVALPLAFLAAKNFTPLLILRGAARRLFDFFRGVDALIWTIVLARAFGPGPLTGALAILITDTGTFGKLFSEALENVDDKQIEGIQSTGAKPLQRYRFGVIPQITPVLLSQVLYYLESNTRSATIIGAITGGGIGLLLTQAMITQKDWEEVSYYIVLIVLMVMLMDWVSGMLRRRLIKG
ncbi:phosphonate ABC transporter, permease protein PhnE [Thalassovita sp.]|jgi:phosphonate transport system permease protein|uniref:phosphonate ABC transporter, permease protein PhnE n=1 Tax=Thalassovita sp. TaxID=1979401 RepID=UPI003B59FDF0